MQKFLSLTLVSQLPKHFIIRHLRLYFLWVQMCLASFFSSRYLSHLSLIVVDRHIATWAAYSPLWRGSPHQLVLWLIRNPIVTYAAVRRELEMPSHSFLTPSCWWVLSEYSWVQFEQKTARRSVVIVAFRPRTFLVFVDSRSLIHRGSCVFFLLKDNGSGRCWLLRVYTSRPLQTYRFPKRDRPCVLVFQSEDSQVV